MDLKSKIVLKIAIFSAILILLDQASKILAIVYLNDNPLNLIPNWVKLSLHFNEGLAFSIPIKGIFVPLAVLFFITLLLKKYGDRHIHMERKEFLITSSLVYGGAVSNLIDRFVHSYVIDFISVLSFPVFNLADSFITISAILIILFQNKLFKS